MIAILPTKPVTNAQNRGQGKETVRTMTLTAMVAGKLRIVADARFYMGRSRNASVVYCSVWFHGPDPHYYSGSGKAGGFGYHKESAALQDALDSAGITLHGSPYAIGDGVGAEPEDVTKRAYIDGCGDDSMREALRAVAVAMGLDLTVSLIAG